MRPGGIAVLLLSLALPCAAGAADLPAIGIIIDDLGDRLSEGREAVELPGPVAMAFLPESTFTPRLALAARSIGKEVLLHLPLEPLHGKAHPMAIRHTAGADAREAMLQRALAAVPFAQGVNNHQGSAMTERREDMDWLMGRLSGHALYFVDSYTSPLSVAYASARDSGLPATRRQVFLDAHRDTDSIRKEFRRLVTLAKRTGSALAIGHPFRETLDVLREELPRLAALGVRLVAPSELIRLQGGARSPIHVAQIRLRLSMKLAHPPPAPPEEQAPVVEESVRADTGAVTTN